MFSIEIDIRLQKPINKAFLSAYLRGFVISLAAILAFYNLTSILPLLAPVKRSIKALWAFSIPS
ncbi:MAG: hypothetical protein ACI9FB_000716 [Candidatus Azotimanducaceae bacterium]|jgi:hypothetical protein